MKATVVGWATATYDVGSQAATVSRITYRVTRGGSPSTRVKAYWRAAGRPMPLKAWARTVAALGKQFDASVADAWLKNKALRGRGAVSRGQGKFTINIGVEP